MSSGDWMPSSRNDQLAMARNWIRILTEKAEAWSMNKDLIAKLTQKGTAANAEHIVPTSERNAVTNARLKTAFAEMIAVMRDVKKRYFYSPPLTDADFSALGLKVKDSEPTPVAEPAGQAEAAISFPGRTQLMLHIKHASGSQQDARAYYGYRIYSGVTAAGETPPANGSQLRESKFTRKKKELFNFKPEDTGKTAYFCVRYENSKGQAGPWGPMTSAIIP